ncbi:MAG: DsbA family protein [Myxococcota bacterium]
MFRNAFLKCLAVMLLAMSPMLIHCNGSSKDSADEDSKEQKSQKSEAVPSEGDDSEQELTDAPGEDLYPGFNFGALSPEQRTKFVGVAKAELCPCPGSTESLHECLQDESARCGLAMQAAVVTAESVNQGLNQTDTLNRIAEVVDAAKKEHEFSVEGEPHRGPVGAPVQIVEFADFTCPHCREAAEIMKQISKKYPEQVVFYYKNFPLGSQESALMAATASLAAHKQDKFWPMHDRLYEFQRSLTTEKIDRFAKQLGMNFSKFKKDMNSPELAAQVKQDKQEGMQAGVKSTPTLYINGQRYFGAKTVDALSNRIEQELQQKEGGDDQKEEGAAKEDKSDEK